jgi:hypothetical protein
MKNVKEMKLPELRSERNDLMNQRINGRSKDWRREKELNEEIRNRMKDIIKKDGWNFGYDSSKLTENYYTTCIFEKKPCRYAYKEDNAFNCKCPSDDELPCRIKNK